MLCSDRRVRRPPTARDQDWCFRNGPFRVNPQSRRRRAGRHLMWSEERESPSLKRSVWLRPVLRLHLISPSRRRDLWEQAIGGLLDPLSLSLSLFFLFLSSQILQQRSRPAVRVRPQ